MTIAAFSQRAGVPPDVRSYLYADAWLRQRHEVRRSLPPPRVPFWYRDPGLWVPLSCATAFVKAVAANAASSATPTLAFGSNVTAGNLIPGFVQWASNTITLTSVTDSLGNTYALVDNPVSNIIWSAAMFYAKNITGGACTVTFHFSSAVTSSAVLHEASGCDLTAPLDVHALAAQSDIGPGADTASSGAVTTTQAGDYIFGGAAEVSLGAAFLVGTGYTLAGSVAGTAAQAGEYLANQGAGGSTTVTFGLSLAHSYTFTGIMAFKAAAGAAAQVPYQPNYFNAPAGAY